MNIINDSNDHNVMITPPPSPNQYKYSNWYQKNPLIIMDYKSPMMLTTNDLTIEKIMAVSS